MEVLNFLLFLEFLDSYIFGFMLLVFLFLNFVFLFFNTLPIFAFLIFVFMIFHRYDFCCQVVIGITESVECSLVGLKIDI